MDDIVHYPSIDLTHADGEQGPPCVIRGAKCKTLATPPSPGVYMSIDWIRCSGPASLLQEVLLWMENETGTSGEECSGLYGCKQARMFANGAKVCWGHPSDIVLVDFGGQALSAYGERGRVETLRSLYEIGLHATRLDICADFVGQGLALYKSASESCRRGELCRARRFNVYEDTCIIRGCVGRTLYLGHRGKNGSGRYGRIYDKGTETETLPLGEWERFEIEYTKETADIWARRIVGCETLDDVRDVIRSGLGSSFEFREVNGRAHLNDRPMVPWYADFMSAIALVRDTLRRPAAELARYVRWARRCVIPTMSAMAKLASVSIDELLRAWTQPEDKTKGPTPGSVIEQFARIVKGSGVTFDDRDRELAA
jgi:Replication initiation factor